MKKYTTRIREHIEIEDVNGANHKLADLEDLEEQLDVDLIEFLSESIYVLKHSNQIVGYTSKGKEIHTDFGYVEEFIEDLKAAIKGDKN